MDALLSNAAGERVMSHTMFDGEIECMLVEGYRLFHDVYQLLEERATKNGRIILMSPRYKPQGSENKNRCIC